MTQIFDFERAIQYANMFLLYLIQNWKNDMAIYLND